MEIKSSNLRKILGLDEPPRRVTEKVRGVMTFDHKTGGSVQVMSAESYERNKKYYVPRKGCRSVMKRFLMYTGDYKLVQKRGDHTYIDHFNFDETVNHDEFYRYYNMRVKSPNTKLVAYKKYFDKDLIRHFEMAYKMVIDADMELEWYGKE